MNMSSEHVPVALITGGTRGIGRAVADALAATHHLLIGGREDSAVRAVVESLPSAEPFVCDLADEQATARAASQITRLDALVHCAGILPPVAPVRESWRATLEINVIAPVHLTELLLPLLREARGLVVFINSGSGLNARSDVSGYAASKFALTGYADGLREAERKRVRVASIHPGRVDTDMQRQLQGRIGREYVAEEHMPVEAVAAAIRLAVESPASAIVESLSIRTP